MVASLDVVGGLGRGRMGDDLVDGVADERGGADHEVGRIAGRDVFAWFGVELVILLR